MADSTPSGLDPPSVPTVVDPTEDARGAPRSVTLPDEEPTVAVPPPGTTIGGAYRVVGRLGEGGLGVVLLAQDVRLDRGVAVKLILPRLVASAGMRARFLDEARAMAAVRHPNVVAVYACGELAEPPYEDIPYYVMEHVPGGSLRGWLERRGGPPLGVAEALRVLGQIADGVDAIHAAGAVHYDLKPGNVLVGDDDRMAVTDFGFGTLYQGTSSNLKFLGTPAYSAPEIVSERVPRPSLASRADVYSLGVMAYELLTGRRPFQARSLPDLLSLVLKKPPAPPSGVARDLPGELDGPLLRALDKDPARRFGTAGELVDALREARTSSRGTSLRVLIADDDPDFAEIANVTLAGEFPGATVEWASDGRAALDVLEARGADLLVLDLQMPVMNGLQVANELESRGLAKDLSVIVVTAVGGAREWQRLWKLGGDAFLVKPFRPEELAATAHRVLKRKGRLDTSASVLPPEPAGRAS